MAITVNIETPPRISESFTQTGHGFVVGDVIRVTNTNVFAKAQASGLANSRAIGIVTAVADANNFTVTMQGYINVGVPVAAAGTVCYLSPTTAGELTSTAPTHHEVPVLIILESGAKAFLMLGIDVLRMKQQLPSAVFSTIAAGLTRYGFLFGYSGTLQATENQRQSISFAGRYKDWYLRTLSTQSATGALVLTVRKNGVNDTMSITIPAGGAAGEYSDTTNQVAATRGDLMSVGWVHAASTTSTTVTMFNLIFQE
jgi:hypothetical protein